MIGRSTTHLKPLEAAAASDYQDTVADRADPNDLPVAPDEAPRDQLWRLAPTPGRLAMAGGGVAAVLLGGAVGYWLGRRHAARPKAPVRHVAARLNDVMELAPVAMHLLANPIVRALALRAVMRHFAQRVGR